MVKFIDPHFSPHSFLPPFLRETATQLCKCVLRRRRRQDERDADTGSESPERVVPSPAESETEEEEIVGRTPSEERAVADGFIAHPDDDVRSPYISQ
jgi:DNA-directed RNA polymerase specialized sigma24 family protein